MPLTELIRDAVVLDFLAPVSNTEQHKNHDHHLTNKHKHKHTTDTDTDVGVESKQCSATSCLQLPALLPVSWTEGYLLTLTGSNGLLPNMDIPASLLSMEPALLHLETAQARQHMERYATQPSLLSFVLAADTLQVYRYYWAQMWRGLSRMVWGPDGWHGALLTHNIESFSIRPMSPSSQARHQGTRKSSKGKTGRPTDRQTDREGGGRIVVF